jgi:hypothetical protein
MGGPSGVGDADLAGDGGRVEGILKHPHLADSAQSRDPAVVEHREAGRIVAPILQPPQSFHEYGNGVSLCHHTDNSTHTCCSVGGPKQKRPTSVPDRGGKSSTAQVMDITSYYLLTTISKYIVLAYGR